MMMMTAKVNMKKILIALAAVVGVIVALILLLGGGKSDTAPTVSDAVADNDARVQFLKNAGWDVDASPKESGQVRIPKEETEVFTRYNALQKSQGYDLSQYAGKTVMRYVYQVNNYPGATDPVYATLLIYKNRIIGGDVTNTAAKGTVQGFRMTAGSSDGTMPETTGGSEETASAQASDATESTTVPDKAEKSSAA